MVIQRLVWGWFGVGFAWFHIGFLISLNNGMKYHIHGLVQNQLARIVVWELHLGGHREVGLGLGWGCLGLAWNRLGFVFVSLVNGLGSFWNSFGGVWGWFCCVFARVFKKRGETLLSLIRLGRVSPSLFL